MKLKNAMTDAAGESLLTLDSLALLRDFERIYYAQTCQRAENLALLAQNEDRFVQYHVARNKHTTTDILGDLAKSRFIFVRTAVAEQKKTRGDTLSGLVQDYVADPLNRVMRASDWDLLKAVGKNRNTTPETLAALAKFKGSNASVYQIEDLRTTIAENESTPPETRADFVRKHMEPFTGKLSYTSTDTMCAVARCENNFPETLARLSTHDAWEVRHTVAGNRQAPLWALERLCSDENEAVCKKAGHTLVLAAVDAANDNPTACLEALAWHPSIHVRAGVANHAQASTHALDAVMAQPRNESLECCVALHVQASNKALQTLAQSEHSTVRWAIAETTDISAATSAPSPGP